MALELTDSNFQAEVMENDKVSLIDFWATWCGPCRMIAPAIEELAEEYEGKATIAKYNIESNSELSTKYGVMNIPTLLFVKNGEVVERLVGVQPKSKLKETLDALI